MTDFGGGPVLDRNFDFQVTSSGDVAVDDGLAELEKDTALRVAEALDADIIGHRFTEALEADIRIDVSSAILEDPRNDSISSMTIEQDSSNQISIDATVQTAEGPFDLVFPP